jgi:hypothetical protein
LHKNAYCINIRNFFLKKSAFGQGGDTQPLQVQDNKYKALLPSTPLSNAATFA